jgi:thiol-disulfide isomerase/thioredoxin
LLVPTRVPAGRHVLIIRCKYPDVLGGRTEFSYPVEIENAEYGKELSDPAFKALSAKFHDVGAKFASLRRVSSAGEAQQGYAEESVIAAQTADNHITQSNADGGFPEWANMGNERLLVIGLRKSDGYTPPNHGLLKFDLSGVPKEAKILGAQVRLTLLNTDQYSSTQAGAVLEAYALRRNWLELPSAANAYSCWLGPEYIHNAKSGSVRWGKPGAEDPATDRYPEAAGTAAIGEFPAKIDPANASKDAPRELRRLVALDITALAQKWHSGEVANHGLLLKMTGSASAMVASSEYPDYPFRPTLVLAYQGEPLKLVVKVAADEDLEAARLKAASEKKPLLVKFYSPTCGICQKVQKTTFADKAVKDLLESKFSFVNLKIEDNAQLAQTLGVGSVPALVILAPDGKTKTGQIDSAQLQDSKVLIKALER